MLHRVTACPFHFVLFAWGLLLAGHSDCWFASSFISCLRPSVSLIVASILFTQVARVWGFSYDMFLWCLQGYSRFSFMWRRWTRRSTVHYRYLHYGAWIALRDRIFSGYLGLAMSGHNNCHALLSCACVHTALMIVLFSLLYWCTEANYLNVMHGSTLSSIRCIGVMTLIIHIFVVQPVGESMSYSII